MQAVQIVSDATKGEHPLFVYALFLSYNVFIRMKKYGFEKIDHAQKQALRSSRSRAEREKMFV